MNPTRRTTYCAWLASQLRIEADLWSGAKRSELRHQAVVMAYEARCRDSEPEQTQKVIRLSVDLLVVAMSLRAFTYFDPTGELK